MHEVDGGHAAAAELPIDHIRAGKCLLQLLARFVAVLAYAEFHDPRPLFSVA